MRKIIYLALFVVLIFSSCVTATFVHTNDVGWSTILLMDNVTYDKGWNEVADILARKYELEIISKDGGYIRSKWMNNLNKTGKTTEEYRNRVTIKFSADRTKIDVKTEAQLKNGKDWINGYDTKVLETLKSDIGGVIGRTSR